jgi:hypothetical protein
VTDAWVRSSMVMHTAVAIGVGPVVGQDLIDWLARAREQGHRMHLIPEMLALRRARPGSLTYNRNGGRNAAYLLAARQAILRRRERQPSTE